MAFLKMNHKQARTFLEKQVSTRFWMFVLISASTGAGYGINRLALLTGLAHPGWRYGIAVLVSYFVLIFGVRVWLGWVIDWLREADEKTKQESPSRFSPVAEDVLDGVTDEVSNALFDSAPSLSSSLSTNSAQIPAIVDEAGNGFRSLFGGLFEGIVDAEGAAPLLLVILILLVALAVVGGWAYLIVVAPEVLGEVALQFLLSSAILPGLRPAMRYAKGTEEMDHAPWLRALFKKTVIPFGLVFAIALGLGFSMHSLNPNARTLKDFLQELHQTRPLNESQLKYPRPK